MSDLIQRLRVMQQQAESGELGLVDRLYAIELLGRSADEIERLTTENSEYKRQADAYYHEAADALAKDGDRQ